MSSEMPELSEDMAAAAAQDDIPAFPIDRAIGAWQFGHGVRSRRFWLGASDADGGVAFRISTNRHGLKRFLEELAIPTPSSRAIRSSDAIKPACDALGLPCMVKSASAKPFPSLVVSAASLEQVETAVRRIGIGQVLIEKRIEGDDCHILVTDGRYRAAVLEKRGRDTVENVTALLHEDIKAMAEHIIVSAGLANGHVQYLSENVADCPRHSGGGFIGFDVIRDLEIFRRAGLDRHGLPRDLLGSGLGHVPAFLLIARESTQRELHRLLLPKLGVAGGLVSADGAWIGPLKLPILPEKISERANALRRYPQLERLSILATEERLHAEVLPQASITQIIFVGPSSTDARERLPETSATLAFVRRPMEAARLIEQAWAT